MFSTHSWIGRDLWNEASTHTHNTYDYTLVRRACPACVHVCTSNDPKHNTAFVNLCERVQERVCVRQRMFVYTSFSFSSLFLCFVFLSSILLLLLFCIDADCQAPIFVELGICWCHCVRTFLRRSHRYIKYFYFTSV